MKKESTKKIMIGIAIVLFYYLASFSQTILFDIYDISYQALPLWFKITYSLTYQLVMLGVIILLLAPTLKNDILDLKKHHQEYFQKYFKYWFLILAVMMASNLLIAIFTPSNIAGNEEAIRQTFETAPIYTFIASVFIAPFLEEFVFRQGLRNIFNNNILFILVSGLVFGGMHVLTSMTSYTELLYIIPYSTPGFVFAYLLVKTDNVLVPASMHFMHNGILMSLQMLMLLLG